MYCSQSCKDQHKILSHDDLECNASLKNIKWAKKGTLLVQSVLRTATSILGSFEELHKLLNDPKKLTIFDVDNFSPKNILAIVCSMAQAEIQKNRIYQTCEVVSALFSEPSEEYKDIFSQVISIYCTNSLKFIRIEKNEIETETGESIPLFGSLFNHSCNENVDYVTFDNKLVFYVNRPIQAGEQLFINYGASYAHVSRNERRISLKNNYDFTCDCDACKKNYPLLANLRKLNRMYEISRHGPSENVEGMADNLIEVFKIWCEYINEMQHEHPCHETAFLIKANVLVMDRIARVRL